jgi:hypothetical protein
MCLIRIEVISIISFEILCIIAKAIDCSYGGINLTGLEAIRKIGVSDRFQRGPMPCRHTVSDKMQKFSKYINDNYLPLTCGLYQRALNKVGSFNPEDVSEIASFPAGAALDFMLWSTGLDKIAKIRSVQIALTCDGARLSNTYGHVTVGWKTVDREAKYLGKPIADYQSLHHCYPIKSYIGKED